MEEIQTKEEAKAENQKRKHEYKRLKKLGAMGEGFFSDFKKFMSKGNIINLAIAFVMGVAFTAIVTSLVDDMFMPLINLIFGKSEIADLHFRIKDTPFYYGKFIAAVIKFILISFVLFLIVKAILNAEKGLKKVRKGKPVPPPPAPPETTEQILKDIRELLRKQDTETQKEETQTK